MLFLICTHTFTSLSYPPSHPLSLTNSPGEDPPERDQSGTEPVGMGLTPHSFSTHNRSSSLPEAQPLHFAAADLTGHTSRANFRQVTNTSFVSIRQISLACLREKKVLLFLVFSPQSALNVSSHPSRVHAANDLHFFLGYSGELVRWSMHIPEGPCWHQTTQTKPFLPQRV